MQCSTQRMSLRAAEARSSATCRKPVIFDRCVSHAAPRRRLVRQGATQLEAVKRVAPVEAAVLLESGYTYLDVRTPEEHADGHAPGAVNIPLLFKSAAGLVPNPDFVQQVKEAFPDTTEQLVVGCRSGNRSARACAQLEQVGCFTPLQDYSNLVDDAGGWLGWLDAKLPVEK